MSLISRSDSTLRGHFPAEVDALAEGFGLREARILLAPFYGDAGRVTIGDVHFVRQGRRLIPVGETEFAADPVFGFRSSNLREWVAEKAPGRAVTSIGLDELRSTSGDAIRLALARLPPGGVCIVNASEERDIELAALGALRAELDGVPLIARTAASYVRARLGQSAGSAPVELGPLERVGLVVVGSHVPTTTAQLERLLERPPGPVDLIELDVDGLLDGTATGRLVARASARIDEALRRDVVPVLATSRRPRQGRTSDEDVRIASAVSRALVQAVRRMRARPGWVLCKGGITSADVAARGLRVTSATVLGQPAPGVSAWRCDAGSRFPGLIYIVFPGNVGDRDALRSVCARLMGYAAGSS